MSRDEAELFLNKWIKNYVLANDVAPASQKAKYPLREARVDVAEVPVMIDGSFSAWAQYTIQVENRDAVAAALKDAGVPTAVYYPKPLHLQPAYADFGEGPGSMPVSEMLCNQVLSLPMHPYMSEALVLHIGSRLKSTLERVSSEQK